MRIIAGLFKGRILQAPQGMHTRPTADRVKEALFSILLPYLEGARVLDLFAGSGALGLEALSRGAAHATFVDNNQQALQALRTNVACVKNQQSYTILADNAADALALFQQHGRLFDLIFLDPPYAAQTIDALLALIVANKLLAADGIVVCEYHKKYIPQAPSTLHYQLQRCFGDTCIALLTTQP